ncbi:extracellular solute-binding protein [Aliihoeflea aestuarii]|uniref:extracellular solute-binding protein n=1 Tax=Aliihoeflea aestuarii TaxID=453840 RepID=UPI0020930959|nr:extracellular solute-binding protein [Aliihoeflea aestuarii]
MRGLMGVAAVTLLLAPSAVAAEPRHAIAMHGDPALPANYAHFPYANPDAPKGGTVTYCVVGTFDNLNPFILRSLRTTARGVIDTIFGNLVFETPMTRNMDEAFGLYGLLAESVEMDEARSFLELNLNPDAKWSDGEPVTPEDVIFTYDVFTEKGRPPFRDRMRRVEKLEKTGPHSVRFTFNEEADREFPLIIAMTPIVPRHAFDMETFDQTTLQPVVGSGPYRIASIAPSQRIVFEKNPEYWGKDIPAKRGFDNYDRITIEYFQNQNAQFEAFKKGICDIHLDADPVQRERDFDFPAYLDGRVVGETFEVSIPPVVTGFAFNTRRPVFADVRVRRALAMLYDFDWVNRNIYSGRYTRTQSYWQGSDLSALHVSASTRERELLAPFPDAVTPDVMDGTYEPAHLENAGDRRDILRAAHDLLAEAGYRTEGGRMLRPDGQPFTFEILTGSRSEERLAAVFQRTLARLGINMSIRTLDDAQLQQRKQRFEFDMLVGTTGFSGTLSPGIELLNRWASPSRDIEGSFNLVGAADPAIDAMIAAMLAARSRDDYVAAVRALDRVLISGAFMVPMQHNTEQWVAYWNRLRHPEHTSLYGYQLSTWWSAGVETE